ncbi:MAG: mandelate racemase/muconate lactonizing enzyme family protein [Syntrophaceae bacterium]|nr:mandelate racemase/muconate lactonizing enzyme family protein [Syntrophaceae bacterium]
MKIKDVAVTRLSWGRRPERLDSGAAKTGTGPGWERSAAFVQIFTDEDITGISLAENRKETDGIIEGPLKNQIVGEDPFDVEKLWYKMFVHWRKPVAAGEHLLYSCISAIDNAIWDIIGKATNQPLYKLLGCFNNKITCYAAGGHYKKGKTPQDLANEMKTYVGMGFRAVKMKIGRTSIEKDTERIKAVREAIGDDITLMIDANNAYSSANIAIKMAKAAAKYHPYWFEEPLYPDDRDGWLEVKRFCNAEGIAVAGGENEFTRWGCREFIQRRCVDIFQADAGTAGGITEWKKMAALCSANHIAVSPHGDPWTHAHLVAHAPTGEYNEVHMFRQYMYDLIPAIPVKDGYQDVQSYMTKPGLGIEINKEEWDVHVEGQKIPDYIPRETEVD